ncbi:TPM domain-containing protein [Sphingomonas hengshuiensis]|uniref:Uncharacterized protein n=1 Tax=Sphingomonas hengshuiensis TaxID=1609977 RepID=A0A7U4LG77_9SPHN|nr:TPM domain-containing protein [Sphingomonas hengshuiensis]AJP73284.1 hypothetical protein TS85_18020 [Sphingomonas hengshuiensis]
MAAALRLCIPAPPLVLPGEDYGLALGNARGVGCVEAEDGVPLIVAPTEGELRIDTDILPHFRQGKMADGIVAGSTSIIREITA